jgi:hypothetical protein
MFCGGEHRLEKAAARSDGAAATAYGREERMMSALRKVRGTIRTVTREIATDGDAVNPR